MASFKFMYRAQHFVNVLGTYVFYSQHSSWVCYVFNPPQAIDGYIRRGF